MGDGAAEKVGFAEEGEEKREEENVGDAVEELDLRERAMPTSTGKFLTRLRSRWRSAKRPEGSSYSMFFRRKVSVESTRLSAIG